MNSFPVAVLETIKSKINKGEVVKYHMSEIGGLGTQAVTYSNNSIANSSARGFDSMVTYSTTSGLGTQASFTFYVFGSVIGIGIADFLSGFDIAGYPDASVLVDDVCYGLRDNCIRVSNPPDSLAPGPVETVFYVPEILPYEWHKVSVILHSLPSAAHTIFIYNIFSEKNLLQVPLNKNSSNYATNGTLTTSDVAIPIILQNSSLGNTKPRIQIYNLEKITYYNSDAADRLVTVSNNSVIIFSRTIAAKQTVEFTPSINGLGLLNSTDIGFITHKADANSLVTFTTTLNAK